MKYLGYDHRVDSIGGYRNSRLRVINFDETHTILVDDLSTKFEQYLCKPSQIVRFSLVLL